MSIPALRGESFSLMRTSTLYAIGPRGLIHTLDGVPAMICLLAAIENWELHGVFGVAMGRKICNWESSMPVVSVSTA